MRSYIGITVRFISNETVQCYAALQTIQRPSRSWKIVTRSLFEEIISNFEITNTRLFNVAGRKFKPERYRLTEKIWSIGVYQLQQTS